MANILNEQYYDLNNWIKNMNSFPVFENVYENGINTLQYQGVGDFERIYIPITVEQNHNYQFRFKFYSPTGFTMGNYGNNFAFAFVRNTEPSDTAAALSKTNLVYSQNWDNNATNISKQYTISFHSGSYTQLYIALDFGYILDGETKTYIFSNFELDDCSDLVLGASCMPNMKDVNICFDARIGVNDTEWKNLKGDINFQLFNATQTANGLEVGNSPSYGKITIPYIGGSSRTRYFIFKNLSGVFQEWRTIIDNERQGYTYQCATVAMDSSGYLQFCRPNFKPSTSLGLKCTDWHVVAMTDNASTGQRKFWIDGVYRGYTSNMSGWSDDIYLGRGNSWDYSNNLTAFRAFIIASSVHSDADVVMNSKWLYDTYITNYISEIASNKYLIQDKDNIYTIIDNNLFQLESKEITENTFITYGSDTIPIWDNIKTLINPKILFWNSLQLPDTLLQLTAQMKATTSIQTLITNAIDLNDSPNITGINQVTLDSDGDVLIAVSFDEKNSWLIFNETDWNITTSDIEGMNKETLEAITSEQWAAALGDSKTIYFKAIFSNVVDTLRKINIEFLMS